jgi:hypothetical protein
MVALYSDSTMISCGSLNRAFVVDWYAHTGSYASGFFGGIVLCILQYRKRIHAISFSVNSRVHGVTAEVLFIMCGSGGTFPICLGQIMSFIGAARIKDAYQTEQSVSTTASPRQRDINPG